jgi:transcriptional regulator with XRE-family HTH domain
MSETAGELPHTMWRNSNPYSDPVGLFDALIRYWALKSDTALAHRLGVSQAVVNKVRRGHRQFSPTLRERIATASGLAGHELSSMIAAMEVAAVAPAPDGGFDPGHLLNALKTYLRLRSDAALARVLDVDRSYISKIRHRMNSVGPTLLVRMHEVSGLPVRRLRALMGDRRKVVRIDE